jgi:CubicO group peptidase (beta-lactamase class C family)
MGIRDIRPIRLPRESGLIAFGMLCRASSWLTSLFCVFLSSGLCSAQVRPQSAAPPGYNQPAPLLPTKGFNDGNGYVLPGVEWEHASPESEGFSPARLEALRAFLKTHQTDAMMVVSRGHVIFEYGNTAVSSNLASVRKSVLDLLYAVETQKGLNISDALNKTVVELGLEDKIPFNDIEKHVVLEQLLMSRSGIYLPSGNGDQAKLRPPRGSAWPGSHYFYNNWDFDAAGIAFEKLTHTNLLDALRDDLAIPLRFQDFDRSLQSKPFNDESIHPSYKLSLSTRDMARVGLFALGGGQWGKTLWASPDFIQYSTYPNTHFNEVGDGYWSPGWTGRWGYGMLWWAWEAPKYPGNTMTGPYQGAFSAMGSGGQYITVFPLYDIVVAHKVNIDQDPSRSVSGSSYMTILDMVLDAKCGASTDKNCN